MLRELFAVGVLKREFAILVNRIYLTDRWHRRIIDGQSSTWQPVLSVVPQGSILGPFLFITYINSAPSVTDARSTTVPLYADDMKCYRIITDYSDEKKV